MKEEKRWKITLVTGFYHLSSYVKTEQLFFLEVGPVVLPCFRSRTMFFLILLQGVFSLLHFTHLPLDVTKSHLNLLSCVQI